MIDWKKELRKCIQKRPTVARHEKLVAAAQQWPTCACGDYCRMLSRNKYGAPHDSILLHYGCQFGTAVFLQDYKHALDLVNKIETQSIRLIAEQIATDAANAGARGTKASGSIAQHHCGH